MESEKLKIKSSNNENKDKMKEEKMFNISEEYDFIEIKLYFAKIKFMLKTLIIILLILFNKSDISKKNKKIGIAFIYDTLYSNGISRFIIVTAENLIKTGKYDIFLITGNSYGKEFQFDSRIKRFIGAKNNNTEIKRICQTENIDIVIVQNFLGTGIADFYRNLGKKIIGMYHGVHMPNLLFKDLMGYKNTIKFDLFDSYIFIVVDDYYFYKRMGFKNEIFIPNLNTFEPSEIKNSELKTNNIMILGRLNDLIKGVEYAIKAMPYIIKEVPDAKLYLISPDSRIEFLKNLTKELNLTNNIIFHPHTYNISSYFWNSSVVLYTSLSEAYPMAMNEAKAHGMPIVAFDVPYSIPYQNGVITVEQFDIEGLARETIKLLKDYNYRKKKGEEAKKSLNRFKNSEIVLIWEQLFNSLLNKNLKKYRRLQRKIEKKYYNDKIARQHLKKYFSVSQKYNKTLFNMDFDNFVRLDFLKNITL